MKICRQIESPKLDFFFFKVVTELLSHRELAEQQVSPITTGHSVPASLTAQHHRGAPSLLFSFSFSSSPVRRRPPVPSSGSPELQFCEHSDFNCAGFWQFPSNRHIGVADYPCLQSIVGFRNRFYVCVSPPRAKKQAVVFLPVTVYLMKHWSYFNKFELWK